MLIMPYSALVFNKIKGRLGGAVKCIISGAAPIAPEVLEFMEVCFGAPAFEGYGQTESSAASTVV